MARELLVPSSALARRLIVQRLRQRMATWQIVEDLMQRYPRTSERLLEREVQRMYQEYDRARTLLNRDMRRNVQLRRMFRCRADQRVVAQYEVRFRDADSGRWRVFTFQDVLNPNGRLGDIVREPLTRLASHIGERYASLYFSQAGTSVQVRDREPGFTLLSISCV